MKPRKRFRRFVLLASLLLASLVGLGIYAFSAWRQVPDFYAHALAAESPQQREASHAMNRKMTALASETVEPGDWESIFTAEQINAWLAIDLARKHPQVLPLDVHDPRVWIARDEIRLAWARGAGPTRTIYSLEFVPYVAEPNVLAVRVKRLRAGALPIPLAGVMQQVTDAAERAGLDLDWTEVDGDHVALLNIPYPRHKETHTVLETIALADQQIILSGRTELVVETVLRPD